MWCYIEKTVISAVRSNGKEILHEIEKRKKDGYFSNYAYSLKVFGQKYQRDHPYMVLL